MRKLRGRALVNRELVEARTARRKIRGLVLVGWKMYGLRAETCR